MIGNVAFELHLARSQLEKYVALIHSMLFIIWSTEFNICLYKFAYVLRISQIIPKSQYSVALLQQF